MSILADFEMIDIVANKVNTEKSTLFCGKIGKDNVEIIRSSNYIDWFIDGRHYGGHVCLDNVRNSIFNHCISKFESVVPVDVVMRLYYVIDGIYSIAEQNLWEC